MYPDADTTAVRKRILIGPLACLGRVLMRYGKGVAAVGQSLGYIAAEREALRESFPTHGQTQIYSSRHQS